MVLVCIVCRMVRLGLCLMRVISGCEVWFSDWVKLFVGLVCSSCFILFMFLF